jgi:hypothetical protein
MGRNIPVMNGKELYPTLGKICTESFELLKK